MEEDPQAGPTGASSMAAPGPPWRRILVIAICAAGLGIAIWLSPLRALLDPESAAAWLRSIGSSWWAPLAFLAIYLLFSLGFIPVLPLAVAATLIWGWFLGGAIELAVATIAALPPYLIARSTASGWVESRLRARFGVNYDRVRIRATSTLFLLRLLPLLPFSAVNYLAGLAAIRPLPYVVATLLGMIPSVFVFTYFVDAVASGGLSMGQASARVVVAGLALAALFVAARIVAAKLHMRRTQGS
ncbi:MAG TPA: VTT domain-containing protein [Thermoanaerobaculia bacterium]|nr:VTT domain-containing protein [Thermoanaerobaculia bacterium]